MSNWREKTWRIPRKGEVVRDNDGNLGIVTRSSGTLIKRQLWISNVNGTEIYTEEEAEHFYIVDLDIAKKFHLERLSIKGFKEGTICRLNDNDDVPLELIYIEWNAVRQIPILWLKDLREFEDNILKTDNESIISQFNLNMPSIDAIFSTEDSGLKWRLQVNLIEVDRSGWAGSGSPWEFSSKESALEEVENWKARLKIRRVASVVNSNWKVQFPCWTVELLEKDIMLARVKPVTVYSGAPVYFPTAAHAATALKMLSIEDWQKSFVSSHDPLF